MLLRKMHFPVPEKLRTNNSRLWKVIQRHTISWETGSRAGLSILCKFYLNNNSSLRQVRADSKKSLAMWATEKTFARLVLYFNRWLFFFFYFEEKHIFSTAQMAWNIIVQYGFLQMSTPRLKFCYMRRESH